MSLRRRDARVWAAGLVFVVCAMGPLACRSKSTAAGGPAGSASAAVRANECTEVRSAAKLVLGKQSGRAPSEEEEGIELPFSVELGEARASAHGFAAPAIENRGGANVAVLALLDGSSAPGQIIELGRVFGDVEPPVVIPHRDRWLAAVANSDAGGATLRLMLAKHPYDAANLVRGSEVTSVRRDATGAALAAHGDNAILVWSTLDRGKGRLLVADIEMDTARLRGSGTPLPVTGNDEAEAPRLAARPSGYYLAYLARVPAKSGRPLRGDSGSLDGGGAPEGLVDEELSAIDVVPLDAKGQPIATPRRLTPTATHVIAFDIAPLADGGALIVYGDAREPGAERPSLHAVRVRPDGSFETRTWDTGESSGMPTLLVDVEPPSASRWGMVAVAGEPQVRLALLGADPLALGELHQHAALSVAEPLALRNGRLLVVGVKGTQRELSVLDCGDPARWR